jgi:hypothetical protein
LPALQLSQGADGKEGGEGRLVASNGVLLLLLLAELEVLGTLDGLLQANQA